MNDHTAVPDSVWRPVSTAGTDNPLVRQAVSELARAGLFDSDADYNGVLGVQALDLVRVFAGRGNSGASAEATLGLFNRLARFEPLTPLTSDPEEWEDVSEIMGTPMWQNRRDSRFLSKDRGQTWTRPGAEEEVSLRAELAALLNRRSMENRSDTPDFVLAQFLESVLAAFDLAVNEREQWHGGTT